MTLWHYRINAIIPDAMKPLVSALWTIIAPEGDPEALSFSVPLSPSGNEPPTHWGMSTAATEEMRLLITQLFSEELAGVSISVQDYTVNDWAQFIAAQGVQAIQREII